MFSVPVSTCNILTDIDTKSKHSPTGPSKGLCGKQKAAYVLFLSYDCYWDFFNVPTVSERCKKHAYHINFQHHGTTLVRKFKYWSVDMEQYTTFFDGRGKDFSKIDDVVEIAKFKPKYGRGGSHKLIVKCNSRQQAYFLYRNYQKAKSIVSGYVL